MHVFYSKIGSTGILFISFFLTLQFSCTEEASTEHQSPDVAVEAVSQSEIWLTNELTYPKSFVEKARANGIDQPTLLPEYKSPDDMLFRKFKEDRAFRIHIDGIEVSQGDLAKYDRTAFKAYTVKGITTAASETSFRANLYTHKGYIRLSDNWIEAMTGFRDNRG